MLGAAFLLFGAAASPAATSHVEQTDPTADDRNDGSAAHPWKTVSHAAAVVKAGDVVVIGQGVYRESVKISHGGTAAQPVRFQAADAANVIITGADRVSTWTAEPGSPGVYSTPWNLSFIGWNPTHTHPDDDYHLLIGRCEQVFVDGQPLRQVLQRGQMSRGTFFVDAANKRLLAESASHTVLTKDDVAVEASTRDLLWECAGDDVQTVGLRFRYAANMAQHGAALFSGARDTAQDCVFEQANSVGATFSGPDIQAAHCIFRDNGQLGFSANRAHRLVMSDCLITRNNAKGFSRDWEAGGDKLVLTRAAVIERCTFSENHGSGIWFDIGNEDCVVRNCLIADNEDAGIFDEISFGLRASDNVIVGNGLGDTPGAWGAQGGICLSSSPNSVIERDYLIGNREGFDFREQSRTTPRIDSPPNTPEEKIWCHDETVAHNVLAYNRDVQLRGWFDMEDERLWPAAMREKAAPRGSLSLEALHLLVSDNVYAIRPGQAMFTWGVGWKQNKSYTSLDDVRRELGLEQNSVGEEPRFANAGERDFRLPASAAFRLQCEPRGAVPGVRLGQSPDKP